MTKLKSKKMTKSTFAIIIMAIVMVAMLAFGGTYAYFTATTQQDTKSITLGYVKLSDNNGISAITVTNAMPGDKILAAGAYAGEDPVANPATGIILTVDTTDKLGNYVAVRFDYQITLKVKGEDQEFIVLNAETVYGQDGYDSKKGTDPKAAEYVELYEAINADQIKAGNAISAKVDESVNAAFTYKWNNVNDATANIYFLVGADSTSTLTAVGVAADADATNYSTTVDLIVNNADFVLPETIQDNWVEGAETSTYGIMEAKIDIAITAASVQATGLTDDQATAIDQLVALLPGVTFGA